MILGALKERCGSAASVTEVGQGGLEAARQHIGISTMNFFPLLGAVQEPEDAFIFSEHVSEEYLRVQSIQAFRWTDEDLVETGRMLRWRRRVFDADVTFGKPYLEGTRIFNEFWKPCRVERQIMALLGQPSAPLGFLCLSRTTRERPFTEEDLLRL